MVVPWLFLLVVLDEVTFLFPVVTCAGVLPIRLPPGSLEDSMLPPDDGLDDNIDPPLPGLCA